MTEKRTPPDFVLNRMREAFCMRGHDLIWANPRRTVKAGATAGCIVKSQRGQKRYRLVVMETKGPDGNVITRAFAHSIAWFLATGNWPTFAIDHKDGDGENNSQDNLRPATNAQNAANGAVRKNNTSGVPGVVWVKNGAVWSARIQKGRKTIYLGRFKEFDDAVAARHAGEIKYHGEFARHLGVGVMDG